jgi:hypothetical protein
VSSTLAPGQALVSIGTTNGLEEAHTTLDAVASSSFAKVLEVLSSRAHSVSLAYAVRGGGSRLKFIL